jgi:hypothetical protein
MRTDKTRRGFSTFKHLTAGGSSSSSSSSAGSFAPQVLLARASSSAVGSVRGGRGGVFSSVPGRLRAFRGEVGGTLVWRLLCDVVWKQMRSLADSNASVAVRSLSG